MSVQFVRRLVVLCCVSAVAAGLSMPGCAGEQPCDETSTCPPEGGAAGEGGSDTGGSGGEPTGGTGGTKPGSGGEATGGKASGGNGGTPSGGNGGLGGGTSSGGGTSCDRSCAGAEAFCDEDSGQCLECRKDADCGGELCDTSVGQCVECLTAKDCDRAAPVCDNGSCIGCEDSTDCADYPTTPVCAPSSGECVECLTEDDCGGYVCAPDTHSCTSLPAGVKFACEECVHDAECQTGQLCVEQEFEGTSVGTFCTWTKAARVGSGGSCDPDGKPFALLSSEATSIDGATADLCVLATTTCPAYFDHRQPHCTGTDDDASCGAADLNDGQCELKSTTYLCTYACGSDVDCKTGFTCTPGGYCSL